MFGENWSKLLVVFLILAASVLAKKDKDTKDHDKQDEEKKHEEKKHEEKAPFHDHISLYTKAKIPLVGLGTWQLQGEKLEQALNTALEIGYRHIDTATAYGNEEVIGKVLQKWLSSGKIKREELFITTKLPRNGNKPELVSKYVEESLKKLQLNYIDLYLVHFPIYLADPPELNADGTVKIVPTDIVAIWKELETQVHAGKLKAIGLSNFNQNQIIRIKKASTIKPAALQIELHIYSQEKRLVDFCSDLGIVVTAFSSLGTKGSFETIFKGKNYPDLLKDETVVKIAKEHGKTPAQILLRFLVQQNIVVIPKSSTKEHLEENFKIFDFSLTREDFHALKQLDKGEDGKIGRLSEIFKGLDKHPEYPQSH